LWIFVLLALGALWLWGGSQNPVQQQPLSYSDFLHDLDSGMVRKVTLSDGTISGTLTAIDPKTCQPQAFVTQKPTDDALAQLLAEHGVQFTVVRQSNWFGLLLSWVLPFGLLILFWAWFARRAGNRGMLRLGQNRIHIHAETGVRITFADVAGAEEAKEELNELIDFLRDPTRIRNLGARMSKGALLVAPPGTGKTLLARAVAGEAGCLSSVSAARNSSSCSLGWGRRGFASFSTRARKGALHYFHR
jgi:cell division protease FtsH